MKREELAKLPVGTLLMTRNSGPMSRSVERRGSLVRFEGLGTKEKKHYNRQTDKTEVTPAKLDPAGKYVHVTFLHPQTREPVGKHALHVKEPRDIDGLWEERDAYFTTLEAQELEAHRRGVAWRAERDARMNKLDARVAALGIKNFTGTRTSIVTAADDRSFMDDLEKLLDLAEIGYRVKLQQPDVDD